MGSNVGAFVGPDQQLKAALLGFRLGEGEDKDAAPAKTDDSSKGGGTSPSFKDITSSAKDLVSLGMQIKGAFAKKKAPKKDTSKKDSGGGNTGGGGPDFWTKYKWWVIGGGATLLVLSIGTAVVIKTRPAAKNPGRYKKSRKA